MTRVTTITGLKALTALGPSDLEVWEPPREQSQVTIGGGLAIHLLKPQPNWFWRWTQRVVFGFEWKAL